jgi:tRNA-2-methylthio-N6-dimethylallyladenosine synthase
MFKYSSRPGTKASEYTDQIPEEIKQGRLEILIDVQLKNTLEQNQNLLGKTIGVLVEKESKKSKFLAKHQGLIQILINNFLFQFFK